MNKFLSKILILVLIVCSMASCNTTKSRTVFAMDTVITVEAGNDEIIDKIIKSTEKIDKALSFHNEESALSKLNLNRSIKNTPILTDCIKLAHNYSVKTGGAFNLALGQVTSLYDFEAQTAPNKEYAKTLLDTFNLENVIFLSESIVLRGATLIDLGGIAKGYALEKAIKILKQENQKEAYLNFGGSIYYLSNSLKSVGIKKPFSENEIAAELLVKNMAVTTAGNYERCFTKNGELYHHIIDAKTGMPVNNGVNSVTVVSSSAIEGDVYSTALFVMGKDEGIDFANKNKIAAVFILEDGSIHLTNSLTYNKENKIILK